MSTGCEVSRAQRINQPRIATYPARESDHPAREVDRGSSDLRGHVFVHLDIQCAQLNQVLAQRVSHVVGLTSLAKTAQEVKHGGVGKIEVEGVKNLSLLLQNFVPGVGVVSNKNVIVDFGRVDLFVLGGN